MAEYDKFTQAWITKAYAQETQAEREFLFYRLGHGIQMILENPENEAIMIKEFQLTDEEKTRLPEKLDLDQAMTEVMNSLETIIRQKNILYLKQTTPSPETLYINKKTRIRN